MYIPQQKVARLRSSGMSVTDISNAVDVALQTIYTVEKDPEYGYKNGRISKKFRPTKHGIDTVHNDHFEPLFGNEEIEDLFALRDEWMDDLRDRTYVRSLERSLLRTVRGFEQYEEESVDAVRLTWLEAEVLWDIVKVGKRTISVDLASYYLKAHDMLDGIDVPGEQADQKAFALWKLGHNAFAAHYDALPAAARKNKEHVYVLRDMNYLENLRAGLPEGNRDWRPLRAGLIVAHLLGEDWKEFWNRLVEVNPRFEDIAYAPSKDLPALADDPDSPFCKEE